MCQYLPLSLIHRLFFFNNTAPTEIYTLSLHDALPISHCSNREVQSGEPRPKRRHLRRDGFRCCCLEQDSDRKSTRLNSSHQIISYAVFCLKKKKNLLDNALKQRASPLLVLMLLAPHRQ